MYPFSATINGNPVLVYDIHQTDTGADCAIVHPNGLTGFAQWSRLIVQPTQTIQPPVDLAELCHILGVDEPSDLLDAARATMAALHAKSAKKPLVWGKWQYGYDKALVRLSADGARIQEIADSAIISRRFRWKERAVNGSVIQVREGFVSFGDAQEACEAFSAERGDEQPHRGNP